MIQRKEQTKDMNMKEVLMVICTVWNSVGLRMVTREFEYKFLDDNIVLFHSGHLPPIMHSAARKRKLDCTSISVQYAT